MSTRTGQNWAYQADVTSAELNSLPQGWIARVRVTGTNQSSIATETILTAFTETATAQGTDRMLKCEASVNVLPSADASDIFGIVRIRSGGLSGTVVAYSAMVLRDSTQYTTIYAAGTDSAVNGSVTYYVTLEVVGVATLSTDHASSRPGMLLVTDLGPSS